MQEVSKTADDSIISTCIIGCVHNTLYCVVIFCYEDEISAMADTDTTNKYDEYYDSLPVDDGSDKVDYTIGIVLITACWIYFFLLLLWWLCLKRRSFAIKVSISIRPVAYICCLTRPTS